MVAEAIQEVAQDVPPMVVSSPMYDSAGDEAPVEVSEKVLGGLMVGTSFFEDLQAVAKATSSDQTRPILTGVLVQANGSSVNLVATDTYRLWVREVPVHEVMFSGGVIIPAAWLKSDLKKIIKEQGGKRCWDGMSTAKIPLTWAEVTTTRTVKRRTAGAYHARWRASEPPTVHEDLVRVQNVRQVLFIGKDRNYEVPLIEGQFVNWGYVVPNPAEAQSILSIQAGRLLEALKWCEPTAANNDNRVRLTVGRECLTVAATATDGEATASAEYPLKGAQVDLQGVGFNAGLNGRYMADFLGVCGRAEVEVRYWADKAYPHSDTPAPQSLTVTCGKDLYILMQMIDPK